MKKWKALVLFLILGFLSASIILYIIMGFYAVVTRILFGVTAAVILGYTALNYKELLALLHKTGTLTGIYKIVQLIIIIGILIFIYLLSNSLSWKIDLTASRLYSLSEETINVLKSVTNEMKVFYFKPSDRNDFILDYQGNMLKTYSEKNGRIQITTADPNQNRALANEYNIKENGTVVFEYQGNRAYVGIKKIYSSDPQSGKITYKGEAAYTGAIKNLILSKPQNIYILQGHGEINPSDSGDRGFSGITEKMSEENFKVGYLNLLKTPLIPADCSLLIIGNPTHSFSVDELDKVDNYIRQGGSVLVLLEFESHITINDILRQMGLFYIQNLAVEDEDYMPEYGKTKIVPQIIPHEITMPIIRNNIGVTMPTAVGILELPENDRVSKDSYMISPLLKTSKNSYGEVSLKEIKENSVSQDKNDLKGPLVLAYAVRKIQTNISVTRTGEDTNVIESRMVVFGDSDFINNANYDVGADSDLFLNSINYLLKREADITIRPKTTENTSFLLTTSERRLLSFIAIIIFIAYIVPGIVIILRRRNRVKS